MAVAIRLKRMGRKKRPFYRIVVSDTREPRQGRSVDDIGYYDPMTEPAQIKIDEEKALMWLKGGAEPTKTVRSLLSKAGVLRKLHEQSQQTAEKEDTEAQTMEQQQPEGERESEQEEP